MKRLILSLLFAIHSLFAWCQYSHNYIQNIQQIARVTFPDTPKMSTTKSGVIYTLKYNGLVYATSFGVANGLGDFVNPRPLDSFYNDGIKGITQDTSAKLIYKKVIVAEGVKGLEFECITNGINNNSYLFSREFFFNQRMVVQMIWFPHAVQRNDNRINTFFNTFKLSIKPSEIQQGTSAIIFSAIKYALIVIMVLAVIIALIVFLVRRSNSKITQ